MKRDKRFKSSELISFQMQLIFYVLYLICKIMIYRLPARDSIESRNIDRFNRELKEIMEFEYDD